MAKSDLQSVQPHETQVEIDAPEILGSVPPVNQPDQCPTCGHCQEDWSSNRGALKGMSVKNTEDRASAYRAWRMGLGFGGVTDIDQVEWRGGKPAALLELTRVDGNYRTPPKYFRSIEDRMLKRDAQGRLARELAEKLQIPAYIVAFRWDLSEFYWRPIFGPAPVHMAWEHGNSDEYVEWLRRM
jgi:hypothetical protein